MKKFLQAMAIGFLFIITVTPVFAAEKGLIVEGLYKDEAVFITLLKSPGATEIRAVRIRLREQTPGLLTKAKVESKTVPQRVIDLCADKKNGCFIVRYETEGIGIGGHYVKFLTPVEIYVSEKHAQTILKMLKKEFRGRIEEVSNLRTYRIIPFLDKDKS